MRTLERAGIDAEPSNKTPTDQPRTDIPFNRYIRAAVIHRAFRYRSPIRKPTVIVVPEGALRRRNELIGIMGKVYRFLRVSRRSVVAFAKLRNEPSGDMGKMCRLSALETCHLLKRAKERNEPTDDLVKVG